MTSISGINNMDLFMNDQEGENNVFEKWLLEAQYPWKNIQSLNHFVQAIIQIQKDFVENNMGLYPWGLKTFNEIDCNVEPNSFVDGFVKLGDKCSVESGAYFKGNIVIGNNCIIENGVRITGNVVIGDNVHLYHGATITGSSPQTDMPQTVWIGNDVKIYQGSVIKASVIMDKSRIYSNCYIGASVVGKDVLIGSGTKMVDAKFRQKNQMIVIRHPQNPIDTGLSKFGSAIGNGVEIGSNVTLYPGSIILPNCGVLPNDTVQDIYDRKIR